METTKLLKKRTMLKTAMLLYLGCFLMPAELKAQLVITSTTTDVSCNGGCDGSATATVIGGVPPYYYQWNTVPVQTTATATGLCSGIYTITVFDSDSIQNTAADSLFILEPPVLVSSLSSVDASCPGCCDGSATVVVSGGTAPYAYLWDDSLAQTTATCIGLCTGTYCVTITDANGCTVSNCVTVTSTGCTLIASATATDVTTCGGSDGTATANPTGGVLPYTYAWSSGGTTQNITGLSAGTYTVTVTDSNGCSSTSSIVVNEPSIVTIVSSTNASCSTCADGSATVTASGGTLPYAYAWYKDSLLIDTVATITSLLPGWYCVTVTDALGCTSSGCVSVDSTSGPCTLSSAIASIDASCPTCADGSATVTAQGGTLPYAYLWDDSTTTATNSGLLPGTYCVTVTDAVGCTSSGCVTIANGQCSTFSSTITSTNASCGTCADGSATVAAAGGTAPYAYVWTKDSLVYGTTATITGLLYGWYCVTVTDAAGCTSSGCVAIDSTSVPPANCSVSIYDSAGVALYAIITQGTAPFTYLWSSGETTEWIIPTGSGVYTVTIIDNSGCSATASYQFGSGVCSANFFPYIDSTQANLVYLIENSTGNNLTYLWDFGDGITSSQQFPTHTYNSYGTYNICLTVSDSVGGCVDIFCMLLQLDSINKTFFGYSVIVVPDPFGITGINNEESNYTETKIYPNPASAKVYVELTGWSTSATITLFNVIGQVLSSEVISLNPGKNTIELDLNNYLKGLYFIRIDSEKLRETKRISKID